MQTGDAVAWLMARMTAAEKIGQLNLVTPGNMTNTGPVATRDVEEKIAAGCVGGMFGVYGPERVRRLQDIAVNDSRLKIPLIFGLDVIHGHRTVFPIPLALSCSWDTKMITESARIAAAEATADGLNWVFSPMVDICRDPRWGRIAEGAGEDPFLGGLVAAAMVRGYQGKDLAQDDTVLACVKHMALYGAAEAGRDYNTVDMSRIRMFEDYLPPFLAAVKAGVGSVMAAFNEVDGIPATGNKWLLDTLLRGRWGFNGLTVSDYTGINEMICHGLGDLQTVSALALDATVDMDMVGEGYVSTLQRALDEGRVSMKQIDAACARVLTAKARLGLLDDAYRYIDESRPQGRVMTAENITFARRAVARSCVLLKNADGILPLDKSARIALVGPLSDDARNMLGTWSIAGDSARAVTLLAGLRETLGEGAHISHAKGANITDDPALAARVNLAGDKIRIDARSPDDMLAEALAAVADVDVIVAAVGESDEMSGEAACRADIGIPCAQRRLLAALFETGKPVVIVVFSGRPLTLEWEDAHAAAILHAWFGGTQAGAGIADVLCGAVNPSARLSVTFPRHVGQVPVYYNHKNTGRPFTGNFEDRFRSRYLDIPNDPLYPFGYGLGYSPFEYGEIRLDKTELHGDDTLRASVALTNRGEMAGEEVVQLYISDPVASIARPVRQLKGFRRVSLQPGETRDIVFEITTGALKFYNAELEYDWEPGVFGIHIGANSRDLKDATVTWCN